MRNFLLLQLFFAYSSLLFAESGILFLAHGSMNHHQEQTCDNSTPTPWEKTVLDTIENITERLPYKSELAFGMWNTKCFDAGISRLKKQLSKENKDLDRLIVLPIFISSHSAVIEMQKFIFKKRPDRVIPLPMVKQTSFNKKIIYLPAIDYNPQISLILAKRFHDLIHLAKEGGYEKRQMELVLVMHGPVADIDNEKWLSMGKKYINDVMYFFPVYKGHVISLRDDAPSEIRDAATKRLRHIVASASEKGRKALILPLLLSKGGIDKGIIKRLEGLEYIWQGEMLLPDSKFGDFLIHRFAAK